MRTIASGDADELAIREEDQTAGLPALPRRRRAVAWRPLLVLGLLLVASAAARGAWISNPDYPASDERFYVSAGRHIANLPGTPDEHYAGAPQGIDPVTEHPPLAKVMIAASMKVLGDRPLGWRLPSVVFGTLAVAAAYFLARSAGARQWEAVGVAALMACDNLIMVYGRLATLDIFVVVFMMVGVGLYLRRRPVLAGATLALGACTKLVGLSAVGVIVVLELLGWAQQRRAARDSRFALAPFPADAVRLGTCLLALVVGYLGLLGLLDKAVTDISDPIAHTRSMVAYAEITTFQYEAQSRGTFTQGSLAPVSRPWEWMLNRGSFPAFRLPAAPPGQPGSDRLLVDFHIRLSHFVLWLAIPAFLVAAYRAWAFADGFSNLAVAWCAATFALLVVVVLRERVSYLYYMVVVLPGFHLALARLFSRLGRLRPAAFAYALLVAGSVVAMFPFRTWGGR